MLFPPDCIYPADNCKWDFGESFDGQAEMGFQGNYRWTQDPDNLESPTNLAVY